MSRVTTVAPPDPTLSDLNDFIRRLESAWVSRITVHRQSRQDSGLRQIYVSLDDERMAVLCAGEEVTRELSPGTHRLRVHNTLYWKTIEFTVAVGEHVSFVTANTQNSLTFSLFAFFLGTTPLSLLVERDVVV
ncbi:MAG: hypothetical protein LBQ09_09470 [Acidobacteriaceae bacterium]|jgi:hypothetical protein|nr:hypothetical protein [Acidobacteriaceae bacterium]